MTPADFQWLKNIAAAAAKAKHIFPEMAACEAALESAWGQSTLFREGLNAFGMKQHTHAEYGTIQLPTREFIDGSWVPTMAGWVEYPTLEACFEDRMATLTRLAPHYENYRRALMAPTPQVYVEWVSKTWATDPKRAEKVLEIYADFVSSTSP